MHIEIQNLCKSFGNKQVLNNVSMEVLPNKSNVIMGPSGSGKSVFLKTLLNFLHKDSGKIVFNNNPDLSIKHAMNSIGILFQNNALFDSLPIWQNIGFSMFYNENKKKNYICEIVSEKMGLVGLSPDVMNLYPSDISGGMQKRVAIARAIISNPSIIFFDEPTSGLDPIMTRVVDELTQELIQELNITALTITHNTKSIHRLCENGILLINGQIQWSGNDLSHSNEYLQQFLAGNVSGPIAFL